MQRSSGRRWCRYGTLALLILGAMTGCATGWNGRCNLEGIVFGGDRAPLGRVEIRVDDLPPVLSDADGRFTVPDARRGEIEVRATKERYEAVLTTVRFERPSQLLEIRVYSADELTVLAERTLADGSPEAALRIAERGLAIDPASARLHFLVALAAYRRGDDEAAMAALDWFAESAPDAVRRFRSVLASKQTAEKGAP